MSMLDLAAFRDTPLATIPFEYAVVPRFVRREALAAIHADFPRIGEPGSHSLSSLRYGPAFAELIAELEGPAFREAFARKYDMDLSNRPVTITVRGRTCRRDGRIHTDSKTKLITVLLYLNSSWESEGGRLRLLRSPNDIEDYVAEVPPEAGALVTFRCTRNAWHGHKMFEGERRSLQLNWVVDESAAHRSEFRHGLSAWVKKLNPFRWFRAA
jgi:SM-20-related protein